MRCIILDQSRWIHHLVTYQMGLHLTVEISCQLKILNSYAHYLPCTPKQLLFKYSVEGYCLGKLLLALLFIAYELSSLILLQFSFFYIKLISKYFKVDKTLITAKMDHRILTDHQEF